MISFFGLFAVATLVQGTDSVDVLVRSGTVYDGSGTAGRVTDVGIRGDRIVFIGDGSRVRAGRTIEARGLIVAPGFIDPHTHVLAGATSASESERQAASALMQGVTTVTIGPDGDGRLGTGGHRRQHLQPRWLWRGTRRCLGKLVGEGDAGADRQHAQVDRQGDA
jgi:hypothetical protein